MTKKEILAYIAGIVDGEGYIGIKKDMIKGRGVSPVYYERLSIAQNKKELVDLFIETFKCGKIYFHGHSKLSKKGYWSWEISNKICVNVLKQIYPYLRIKKPEAKLVIKLSKNKRQKYFVLPKEIIEYREKLYQNIKILHSS